MKILLLLLIILTLGLVGFNVYLGFVFKRPLIVEKEQKVEVKKDLLPLHLKKGLFELGKYTINLINESKASGYDRFLQTTVVIEYLAENEEEITEKKATLVDIFLDEAGQRRIKQLDSLNAKVDLKSNLISRFNQKLTKTTIQDIYFEAFTIQ